MLTIVGWNVNSLRARLPLVLRYLDAREPDVLCLQETRLADAAFPRDAFTERGYQVATAGDSSYAGVAIASRVAIDERIVGIDGFTEAKAPGRRLACRIGSLWVDNVYVPTRKVIGKVPFLDALHADHMRRFAPDADVVLAGDFNICFDERDYASPKLISDPDVHPRRPEDLAFRRLVDDRLVDCFRRVCAPSGHFTWFPRAPWAFARHSGPEGRKDNYGMRLDYVFASAPLAARIVDATHDREPHEWPRPSDHLPVRVRFDTLIR